MQEIFKPIKGYDRYSVSNKGRVINNNTGKVISQRTATNGYLRVNLRTGNVKYEKPHVVSVHRLVAEAFIPKENDYAIVNHKDANKQNNNVENLEWCTASYNSIHAFNNISGLADIYNANVKKAQNACKKAIKVFRGGIYIGTFESITATANELGIDKKTVYNGLHGTNNRLGYSFCYEKGGI